MLKHNITHIYIYCLMKMFLKNFQVGNRLVKKFQVRIVDEKTILNKKIGAFAKTEKKNL